MVALVVDRESSETNLGLYLLARSWSSVFLFLFF